jgi:NAD(P)-dependent dehydrogenase (short-subunit alcohol dehydrogenase family)
MKNKNQVIVITGGGRGLGALLGQRIVERGGRVALLDVNETDLSEMKHKLGSQCTTRICDVRKLEDMTSALAQINDEMGHINCVVANAGVLSLGSIETMNPEEFQRTMDVNVTGVFNTIRASIPYLRQSHGYLQVISSLAAAIHTPLMSHYAASKAAVEALADVARQELRPDGIDVGCVHPTFTHTQMLKDAHSQGGDKLWSQHKGLFSAVEPEEVVHAMYQGIVRRERKTIVPKLLAPAIVAPGLVHWAIEKLGRLQGSEDAVLACQESEKRKPASLKSRVKKAAA